MQSQVWVFTGSEVTNLTAVYFNRRNIVPRRVQTLLGPIDVTAGESFNASTSQEYLIQVSLYRGKAGSFSLAWGSRYATNDYFRKPSTLGFEKSGTITSSNVGASRQWAEPTPLTGGRSVWFHWRAPFSGPATFDTAGSTIDTLIARTERAVLITNFWYIRSVDPSDLTITGMTRDGTFLVEEGRIVAGLRNFRFRDSPLRCLQRVDAATPPMESITLERGKMLLPALRLPDFHLSSVTQF